MNRDTRMDALKGARPVNRAGEHLERLTQSDYAPFLLLFSLFIAGIVIFGGGLLFVVIGGRLSLALIVLIPIVGGVVEVKERWAMKNHRSNTRSNKWNETNIWPIVLGWFIPRQHREAIVGDILEDCSELRGRGLPERSIKNHVLWQWAISVVSLIPTYVMGAIGRLWSTK